MRILVLLLMITACAPNHEKQVSVDPEFQQYVTQFQADYQRITGEEIIVDDLVVKGTQGLTTGDGSNGLCQTGPGMSPTITIAMTVWADLNAIQREALMNHEMGHCLLHRAHRLDEQNIDPEAGFLITMEIPVSYMYPDADDVTLDPAFYTQNRDKFLQELFTVTEPSL